jgi:hypothetical protein
MRAIGVNLDKIKKKVATKLNGTKIANLNEVLSVWLLES